MPVQRSSPDGLVPEVPFAHVAVSTGTRHVVVAGQIASDASGALVAHGDLTGQVAQALRNVGIGLAGGGATFDDVVRFTFYIAGWSPDQHDAFIAGVDRVASTLGIPQPMPPSTLIGVASLVTSEALVEIEATAIVG